MIMQQLYLSSLVPNFSDSMKYAVVAGALTGGGLTVIANAPNPAWTIYFKANILSEVWSISI